MKTKKIIKASFFHSPTYGDIEFLEHAILLVSDNGIISEIIRKEDENYQQILNQYSHESNFIDFKDKVLLPVLSICTYTLHNGHKLDLH